MAECIICKRDSADFTPEDINPNGSDDPGCCPSCLIPYMATETWATCPECQEPMIEDEEYYATDQSYWNGLIPKKDIVHWCDTCEKSFVGGKEV